MRPPRTIEVDARMIGAFHFKFLVHGQLPRRHIDVRDQDPRQIISRNDDAVRASIGGDPMCFLKAFVER
jgi:hypothetical protein